MGYGDQLMATGLARGAKARGKRIAFGDGRRILWDSRSPEVFRNNPNIARPGSEGAADLEWVRFYHGHRTYNSQNASVRRWIWNMQFRPTPGEVFFSRDEIAGGERFGKGFVLIEPNVPELKIYATNKDWGFQRWQQLATRLSGEGFKVAQFRAGPATPMLSGVRAIETRNFRDALAVLGNASLYIGPEGGLHHGAAAMGRPAVVLFGGFIPPSVTGYETHVNLTGGAAQACGSLRPCPHCRKALDRIGVDEVFKAATALVERQRAA